MLNTLLINQEKISSFGPSDKSFLSHIVHMVFLFYVCKLKEDLVLLIVTKPFMGVKYVETSMKIIFFKIEILLYMQHIYL